MHKACSDKLTAGLLSGDFNEKVCEFIATDQAIVEFQIRGSPHIHLFFWKVNAPTLTKDNKEEYIGFVENIIHVTLPHKTEQPELYKLITTYRCSRPEMFCEKMFLKISQNLQENTCARVPFLIKLQARGTYFYRTPVFIEHLWWLLLNIPIIHKPVISIKMSLVC